MKKTMLAFVVALSAVGSISACDTGPAAALQTPQPIASAQDPSVREAVSAASSFDVGHTVHLTAKGIEPLALASLCCAPVIFKNETTAAVSVIFNISKVNSGRIAPGATWQWTPPNPESVIYHLGTDPKQSGQIQVESPNW